VEAVTANGSTHRSIRSVPETDIRSAERVNTTSGAAEEREISMERVTGIGGVFFRASEPVGLAHWYRDHLGVDSGVDGGSVWKQEPGPTVFAPVESDAGYYFAGPDQAVMVNFRVRDLDAMVAQLRAAGADVAGDIETEEGTGRFAWVVDPEGNRVQLWEPHLNE
jgi:hypothetical protein